jgi:hypothetical protein
MTRPLTEVREALAQMADQRLINDGRDEPPTDDYDLGYLDCAAKVRTKAASALATLDRVIEGDGWLPIESAPRLESVIVTDGQNVCQSFQGKVSHVPIYGWLNLFCDPENVSLLEWKPTHWRPLPTPPEAK